MAAIYFINEAYFKNVVPVTRSVDEKQIVTAIKLVQETDIKSTVSTDIYAHFINILATGGTFTSAEEIVFKDIQMLLALLTAEQLTYIAPRRDVETKSTANVSYRNKITILEARVIRGVKNDPNLLAIAQGSPSGFDEDEMNLVGGFFFL